MSPAGSPCVGFTRIPRLSSTAAASLGLELCHLDCCGHLFLVSLPLACPATSSYQESCWLCSSTPKHSIPDSLQVCSKTFHVFVGLDPELSMIFGWNQRRSLFQSFLIVFFPWDCRKHLPPGTPYCFCENYRLQITA